jgi:hydrogenase/urease accessory protein HupE
MLLPLALLAIPIADAAHADVFRPAYLELREADGERYDVLWKVPAQSEDMALALDVAFPNGTRRIGAERAVFTGNSLIRRWQIERPGGLVGATVRIAGRAARATDVIARVERRDGTSQVERLSLSTPAFEVVPPTGTGEIAWSYLVLGVEHILGGIDHLLFVFALLLVVRGGRRIFATITAFTLAHSLTLVSATLGWVDVPGPPVEAIIALSIVFVAAEVIHGVRGRPGLTARAPWTVAFTFGLLHGFGFAGALAEVGLPQTAIPIALLMFNVGVELGQLFFVAAALSIAAALGRIAETPAWFETAAAYGIGGVAMFWVFERVAAFWE